MHIVQKKLSLHAQATVLPQHALAFTSPYMGENSLIPNEPIRTSITTTLFAAYKPFAHTYLVFNPEMAAGKGLSKTTGVAGFPNGEIYRVGSPTPQIFVARLYAEQRIPLSKHKELVEDDQNQIQDIGNADYISILAGKFALTDFFDQSEVSHDARTQFMNWSLMANGAWDYPANVRGYTYGIVAQAIWKKYAVRIAETSIPIEANGTALEWKGKDASGFVAEISMNKFGIFKKATATNYHKLHVGYYRNRAQMGNYEAAIKLGLQTFTTPDITETRMYGRSKNGYYINLDNHFGYLHHFVRHSANDGKNETWAFTEIDNSWATGFLLDGNIWKRKKDALGIACVTNGISNAHQQYLANGGYGFIVGDGKLNYGRESIVEIFYSLHVWKKLFVSPDYQYITNPAYNKDRGPASVLGLRFHVEL
jgi:high affinity Mn2+ porin